jgi:hypothetical protein
MAAETSDVPTAQRVVTAMLRKTAGSLMGWGAWEIHVAGAHSQ